MRDTSRPQEVRDSQERRDVSTGAVVTLRVTADVVLGGLEVTSVFSSLRVRNSFAAWRLFIVLH